MGTSRPDIFKFVASLKNSSSKRAVIMINSFLNVVKEGLEGDQKFNTLQDNAFSVSGGLGFPRFFHFYDAIDELIKRIIPTGLFDQWTRNFFKSRFAQMKPPEKEPEILTVNKLLLGFQIWLICLLICFICFIMELIVAQCINNYSINKCGFVRRCVYRLLHYYKRSHGANLKKIKKITATLSHDDIMETVLNDFCDLIVDCRFIKCLISGGSTKRSRNKNILNHELRDEN